MKRKLFLMMVLAAGMTAKATIVTTVNSAADLQLLASSVNAGDSYAGVTVTLTTDIDMGVTTVNALTWTPIGTSAYPFSGTFDGGNHTISNLYVTIGGPLADIAGLFGKIASGGTVKDVHIHSGAIRYKETTVNCYSGSIAGINEGAIIGCSNQALVCGNVANATVGGIAGENLGSIQNCYNLGEVYTSNAINNFLGGIAGYNTGTIQNCFTKATIDEDARAFRTGRIAGDGAGTVTGCFYMNGTATDFPAVVSLENAADNTSTISGNTGSGKNVLLNDRILYSDGNWNTLCLPFSIPAGASGYSPIAGAEVKELENSSITEGKLTINFTDATSMEAGKPYLVKWNNLIEGNLPNPVFTNVTICEGTTIAKTLYINFIGCFSPKALAADDRTVLYLGAANKLYYPNEAMNINACNAYFSMKAFRADNPTTSPTLSSSMMTMPEGEQQ